jgi:hypothetical protein
MWDHHPSSCSIINYSTYRSIYATVCLYPGSVHKPVRVIFSGLCMSVSSLISYFTQDADISLVDHDVSPRFSGLGTGRCVKRAADVGCPRTLLAPDVRVLVPRFTVFILSHDFTVQYIHSELHSITIGVLRH